MAIIKIRNAAIDLDAAEIPNLPASKITSGTLDNARISLDAAEIPNLDTAKITTGTFATAKLADDSVTLAKLNDASVSLAKLTATGTKSSSTFLRGDNTFASAGITMADSWRVHTGFTGDAQPITSNWERNDTNTTGFIGTGMSESSGTFTFPQTGIYRVDFHVTMSLNSNSKYNLIGITATNNNSSYSEASTTYTHISNNTSSTTYTSAHTDSIIDVTDTSNVKVRFQVEHHDNNTAVTGGSSVDYTYAHFIRLGDT